MWNKINHISDTFISHYHFALFNHTHSKNIDKCGENPQSARRKPNYHTKCDKNSHKILSVYIYLTLYSSRFCDKSTKRV